MFVCPVPAAPEEWTMIPVLVKIYKLLINELSNQMESSLSNQADADEDEDEVNHRGGYGS